jgi:adenylate kinase family enzyme
VIGSTGSGKTTFSRALAQHLGVPHVELDALFWQPEWVMTPAPELREKVAAALVGDAWVVDGNYGSRLGMAVLERADEIVWLDLPLRITFWRLLRRTLRRLQTREVLWGGNTETFRNAFLSRNSILLFALRTYRRGRRARAELVRGFPHIRLRSARQVARYLDEIA